MAISGRLDFNPATDSLQNENGESVMLDEPKGYTFPPKGFVAEDLEKAGLFIAPKAQKDVQVVIDPSSKRLQKLEPFAAWDGKDYTDMPLLIKTQG